MRLPKRPSNFIPSKLTYISKRSSSMSNPPSFTLLVLRVCCFATLFFVISSAGLTEEHRSVHPVDPYYAPRRRLAQTEPVYNVSLYYAEAGYQDSAHYASVISWSMRYPAVVASDHLGIRSIKCDIDGIHLEFSSQNFKLQADKWAFPLVIVLDGDTGNCASDGPGWERYHPFFAISLLQSQYHDDQPTTLSLSGFRSRWDVVAYEHQIRVVEVKAEGSNSQPSKKSAHARRGLAAPTTLHVSPSLNFDHRENKCSTGEVPINISKWPYGSLDIKCKNCFVDSDFQLSIDWASRIINAGIKCINKLMKSLYRAEQQLIALAQSAEHIVVSQFSKLSEKLVNLISEFYNRVNEIALSTDHTTKIELKAELGRAISSVEDTSAQLLTLTQGQLAIGLISAPISPQNAFLAMHELKEVISSTSSELELMIKNGTQLVTDELTLPLCDSTAPHRKNHIENCRRPPKETAARLTGRLKANFDVELILTGSGEVSNGDVTVLSINLPGLVIPGILSVGSKAQLISNTALVFTSSANLTLGAEVEWQNIDATIDGHNPQHGQLNNTHLDFRHHRPQFEINPQQLSLYQHFKPQVTFGIDLLLGSQNLVAGIGADVGLTNTLQLPLEIQNKETCSNGLKYDFSVTAQLEALMSASSVARFLISKLFLSMAAALSHTPYPLLVSPKLTFLEHCFQLPAEMWSLFDWDSTRFTSPSDSERISSTAI
ncbi:hypothetical protein PTTG_12070 [Puccinia triticina 1-1 BBBD Race 1]|uniref:Uncharacterized protein n=1 Tax=Puccinia triticina (isolate 1-1 / race 1 (BBBD)) TaxID=630390 RepID=A0A180GVG7_PUCT1|nr:hypothetical protein PTTG_12070 [Puccinia triticina 1-1 BBBD Race 1]